MTSRFPDPELVPLDARAAALAAAHPGTDVESALQALSWIEGVPMPRSRGLAALASLPPRAALVAVGLGDLPAQGAAETRKVILAALGADPFRSPERPLSPAVESRAAAGLDLSLTSADEARAPAVDARALAPALGTGPLLPGAAAASLGGDRPWTLLARIGGLEVLGGIFVLPPELSPGPDDQVLALEPNQRVLLLRPDAQSAEVVQEFSADGAHSAAWHPTRGLLLFRRDGAIVDHAGAEIARGRVLPPARLMVAEDRIYLHSRSTLQLFRVEADGSMKSAMDESATAVAVGPGSRIVALLRAPRAKVPGKKVPTHRLARMTSSGPETIGAIDGEGEVALLGDIAFHIARDDGRLTIADLGAGAIRRIGRLPGSEGTTSLIATRRALITSGTRTGWIRVYGPAGIALEGGPPPAQGVSSGALEPIVVPAGIVAVGGTFAVLQSGEVLRIRVEASGKVDFEAGALRLGRSIRTAAATPEGGMLAVPVDGSPIIEVAPTGETRELPFSSTRIIGAARFGRSGLALASTDGDLVWVDRRRGVLAELKFTSLRAITPIGRDLALLHEGGLERMHAPGMGSSLHGLTPALRTVGGGPGGLLAATSSSLLALRADGVRIAEVKAPLNREPMLTPLAARRFLAVPKGGTEGFVWTI